MIEEIRRRFLPRFVAGAQGRIDRGRASIAADDREAAARELHALAGEASLLGLDAVAMLARTSEEGVRAGEPVTPLLEQLSGEIQKLRP
jgi:HPt (histidine-containing phosphotransfer) domain-containing protein